MADPVFIDDEINADWVKQTWDVYDDEGLVDTDERLEVALRELGMSMDKFRTLPAYQGYLAIRRDGEEEKK